MRCKTEDTGLILIGYPYDKAPVSHLTSAV